MVMALKEETMATIMALSTRIEELKEELALCRAAVWKRVSGATLSDEDVPKSKEFVGIRSACDVDNFLWRVENYFRAKGIMDDAVKEVEQRGVQKLLETMTVAEFVVKLRLGKDKLGFSKSEERGVYEKDHNKDVVDGNDNDNNGGNGKPQVGKKKPNKKRDNLKCFLCDGPHILKKCPKKSALSKKEKPVGKALGLCSSVKGVEAKEAESEKKPVKCFLCHGPHRL
ncbi:hypothetical protein J1N35_021704 [Gossypium stocksii]|uniref:Retrotransposon gag domain-containing protein n=1 Tax=Gossypium stocksii TaxID=47602 RepID=A0A9D3VF79_9ROSI|nr:hypothetical protein J1N35_021704 [Gossypium stocksii]